MWIRSQDKKMLVKVDMIELLDYENSIVAYNSIKFANLGKYSTKEKALKVLDMIQQCVSGFTDDEVDEYYQYGVFQMPQEDEVSK